MRIAFITHYAQLLGANRSLLNLIEGLREYGVESYVIAPFTGDITETLCERGVPFAVIPFDWWVGTYDLSRKLRMQILNNLYVFLKFRKDSFARLYRNIRSLPSLIKQLKAWNVDVIYTNTSVTPIGAMAALFIRQPHVWHLREMGDLDYGFYYDWGKKMTKNIICKANAKIAISNAVSYYYLSGCCNNSYIVYNGVASITQFDYLFEIANRDSPIKHNYSKPYTFVLIGLLHPAKGQEVAIKALALLVSNFLNVRLLIVGNGDANHLITLAKDLGVAEYVEFLGFVKDPYKVFFSCDAVLMCSRYEAMGRVTVEAMSACRPVIGFDQGGTSEIIEHENTGLLYRGGPDELAECMRKFLENPDWARQLGNNGWNVARHKYTIEVYSRSVYEILSSIASNRN